MLDKFKEAVRGIIYIMAKKKETVIEAKEEVVVAPVTGFDPEIPENKQREYR